MNERTKIIVRNEGTCWRPEFVAEWDGQEVRATNPFLLDSRLEEAGAPKARDHYLEEQ